MRLLLDTHVLLWILEDVDQLAPRLVERLASPSSDVLVSAASLWEIAIKRGLGKLDAPTDLAEHLVTHRFATLDITGDHALAVEHLPAHHSDPFDRLLVAQATIEGLTIVTRDPAISRYDVDVFPA